MSAVAAAGLALGTARAPADSGPNPACPASNAPNTLTLAGGSPQTAVLDTAFAGNSSGARQHERLSADDGRRRVPVTFSAPASGASGTSRPAGRARVTVGSDASGMAAAAMFSANGIAGSYTIIASSAYGSVSFAMTNTAAGIRRRSESSAERVSRPRSRRATSTRSRSGCSTRAGHPLQGVSVTFTLGAGGGGSGASGAGSAAPARASAAARRRRP